MDKEQIQEITEKLEQGVSELFSSQRYAEYLATMAKFHNYSLNNIILIIMQRPDATQVAGYNSWLTNFKRQVKRGEKAIKILAPIAHKTTREVKAIDKDGNEEVKDKTYMWNTYRIVNVFDIAQTDGEPLPDVVHDLTENVNGYAELLKRIESTSPVKVEYQTDEEFGRDGAKGYYSANENKIGFRKGMPEAQTVKTLVHEIAHAMLYDDDKAAGRDRTEREVEAESIAYAVCQRYGIDTSDYSFGYIAEWSHSKEMTELKTALNLIKTTATSIIESIDKQKTEAEA